MKQRSWTQGLNFYSDKRLRGRKWAGIVAFVVTLAMCGAVARAQQPARIPRIGILIPASASSFSARVEALRQRLRELGYVEGKNILIEVQYAEGKRERVPDLAAELVRLKVDVIVTNAVLAAKKASATIPIIFTSFADPVGAGFVSSLARPGGNITGLSAMSPDLDGKRLELLKESFLKLLSLEVRSLDDFEGAFAQAKRDGAEALIATPHTFINTQQRQVLEFAAKNRLPAMYPTSEFVEAGGLMSYGQNFVDSFRRVADFVDKVLKGAKPADIPVEQPMKFEFIINLNAAKQIGVTIPSSVLSRADRVIK